MLRHAAIPDNYRLSQKNKKFLCVEWAVDHFLADRTNGRAYATLLRLSSVCLWRYVLWLNGAS